MSANKVNAFIRNEIKMPSVSLIDKHLSLGRLIVEIRFFVAAFKSHIVYINADNVTIEELGFNKRCAASSKLVED